VQERDALRLPPTVQSLDDLDLEAIDAIRLVRELQGKISISDVDLDLTDRFYYRTDEPTVEEEAEPSATLLEVSLQGEQLATAGYETRLLLATAGSHGMRLLSSIGYWLGVYSIAPPQTGPGASRCSGSARRSMSSTYQIYGCSLQPRRPRRAQRHCPNIQSVAIFTTASSCSARLGRRASRAPNFLRPSNVGRSSHNPFFEQLHVAPSTEQLAKLTFEPNAGDRLPCT
jgi:hypothetical protein